MPPANPYDLPEPEILAEAVQPEAAIAFWAWKTAMPYDEVKKLAGAARDRAFYVTALAEADAVQTVKDALGEALQNGETFADFQARIASVIQEQGWKGERIEAIFRNNLQAAYSAGRYAKMQDVKKARPFWQYITVGDDRVRPSHAILHERVWPADHEFWQENFPPNGHKCRCAVRTLSARQVAQEGLAVEADMPGDGMYTDPKTGMEYHVALPGADDGWRGNPGRAWVDDVKAGLPLQKHNLENTVPLTPKKEPLTMKKLEADIAALTAQMQGVTDKAALAEMEAKKAEYQALLDKKSAKAEKKRLAREQARLRKELDGLTVKTYSGIWQDDVTTADWKAKSGSIEAKKEYFQGKLAVGGLTADDVVKFERYVKELEEFNAEGKRYHDIQARLKKNQDALSALGKGGKKGLDDPFSQARKDAALWAKTREAADAELRGVSGEVWRAASKAERRAAYEYTSGSGSFNRPLRGYENDWYNFKGIGKVDLNHEGQAHGIKHLTDMINRSSYDKDIWLQRGVSQAGTAAFLRIDEHDLRHLPQAKLEAKLLGERRTDTAFASCGSAKATGFSGVIYNIYCPKGTKMLYAGPFSAYGAGHKLEWDGKKPQTHFDSELETIIQRGTSYRITKIEKKGGNMFIDMEVVEQI